jgi:hypothetical protein
VFLNPFAHRGSLLQLIGSNHGAFQELFKQYPLCSACSKVLLGCGEGSSMPLNSIKTQHTQEKQTVNHSEPLLQE